MVEKKKNKELTWDEIGTAIGKKIEKHKDTECGFWKRHWTVNHVETGGGFGRLVFGASVMYALHLAGVVSIFPTWLLVLIVLGFAGMRF